MRLVSFTCAAVVAFAPLSAIAQDPVKVASTHYKVLAENERVRVLRGTLPAGATTVMHDHPTHVAVSLSPASVRLGLPDGQSMNADMKADEVQVFPAGKHATSNVGTAGLEVVIIELKGTPGTAQLPSTRPGMKTATLLDDPRVKAMRVSIEPSFKEPAGSTHEYDQVVVSLGPGDVALAMQGKTTSTWKRGDVALIGRGVAHETTAGTQGGDLVIVAIR